MTYSRPCGSAWRRAAVDVERGLGVAPLDQESDGVDVALVARFVLLDGFVEFAQTILAPAQQIVQPAHFEGGLGRRAQALAAQLLDHQALPAAHSKSPGIARLLHVARRLVRREIR